MKNLTFLASAGGLLAVLLIWVSWSHRNRSPSLQLPAGVSLADALQRGSGRLPRGWYTNRFTHFTIAWRFSRPVAFSSPERFRAEVREALGVSMKPVPNPARSVLLMSNLAECSGYSGETYLLAKELFPKELFPEDSSDGWPNIVGNLGFIYGGVGGVRRKRDWIALNEAGLVKNGVVVFRLIEPAPTQKGAYMTEAFLTNECAIIRDTRGIVKVVPLDSIRAYSDAGLITLKNLQ